MAKKDKEKKNELTPEEKLRLKYDETTNTIECETCNARLRIGCGGTRNYDMHKNSPTCLSEKAKRERQPPPPKPVAKAPKQKSLFSWISRPAKANTPIASSSAPILPVTAQQLAAAQVTQPPAIQTTPKRQPRSSIAKQLKELADGLIDTIPEATSDDKFALYANEPHTYNQPGVPSEDLWQAIVNPLLKSVLDYSTDFDPSIIRRGPLGVEALVWVVDYFVVERGVEECMFEGKLGILMNELKKQQRIDTQPMEEPPTPAASSTSPPNPPPSPESTAGSKPQEMEATLGPSGSTTMPIHIGSEGEESDIELVLVESTAPTQQSAKSHRCVGFKLDIPEGKSPHTAYPFGLHASQNLPYGYAVRGGDMFLTAHDCHGLVREKGALCRGCAALSLNPFVRGILNRMNNGTHINTTHAYRGFEELCSVIKRQADENQYLRFHALTQARSILRKTAKISDHDRLLQAISTESISRVDRVIHVALKKKRGVLSVLKQIMAAARGVYSVKSYTEQEWLLGTLLWRLGGVRVGHIVHRALGLPGVNTLQESSVKAPIIPCAGTPTVEVVTWNTVSVLEGIAEILRALYKHGIIHAVLMLDELACEKRLRYCTHTGEMVGLCRQHGPRVALKLDSIEDVEEVYTALDKGEVHFAGDATICGLGLLSAESRINASRTVMISGDCHRESGAQHASVVTTAYKGINLGVEKVFKDDVKVRIVSLASDGESRRGAAFVLLTFKKTLPPTSPIYPLLSPLSLMNMHVGDDDLTCDKDWKHVIKRLRNLLLRERGVLIDGFRITPSILQTHLRSGDLSPEHVNAVFKPDDLQDVKLAFDLLRDIWSLPPLQPDSDSPSAGHGDETAEGRVSLGFRRGREALRVLGRLLQHLVYAYLCVDLTLAEQLEHLSAAAHLAFVLYKLGGKDFLPTLLFVDIIIMIKNVFFCVAKAKVDDPDGVFFVILLGTDRLEIHFGILRTVVGNDCNLDVLQIADRSSGIIEVADILAQKPEWDKGPRRMALPTLSRDAKEIPNSADHLSPKHLKKENYLVKGVTPLTCWRKGRALAIEDFPKSAEILNSADEDPNIDMLSPDGALLVTAPLAADDIDESTEAVILGTNEASTVTLEGENRIDIEIEISELETTTTVRDDAPTTKHTAEEHQLIIDGKPTSKAKLLAAFGRFRKKPNSTDRLKRVQEIARYALSNDDSPSPLEDDTQLLLVHDPVAVLVWCDGRMWLAIGEVSGIRHDKELLDRVGHSLLGESALKLSVQLIGLRPATSDDDDSETYDWRTISIPDCSFDVAARFVEPLDPTVAKTSGTPFYLFKSAFLVAHASLLLQRLVPSDLKLLPKLSATTDFPYREKFGTVSSSALMNLANEDASGKGCFLAEAENQDLTGLENDSSCTICTPPVALDLGRGPRVLEHMGAHLLFDTKLNTDDELCGLCLRPATTCQYYVVKGKGAKGSYRVDRTVGCTRAIPFSYKWAAESSEKAPCSNVPMLCPLCPPKTTAAVWRYNLRTHLQKVHSAAAVERFRSLWEISESEKAGMKRVWVNRRKTPKKKKPSAPKVTVSDAHKSIAPLHTTAPTTLRDSSSSNKETGKGDQDSEDVEDGDGDEEPEDEGADDDEWDEGADDVQEYGDDDMGTAAEGGLAPDQIWDLGEMHVVPGDQAGDLGAEAFQHTQTAVEPVEALVHGVDGEREKESTAYAIDVGTKEGEEERVGARCEMNAGAAPQTPPALSAIQTCARNAEEIVVEERVTRRGRVSKRKVLETALNACLCGEVAELDDAADRIVLCRTKTCETKNYHFRCIEDDIVRSGVMERSWNCEACRGNARGSKRARR